MPNGKRHSPEQTARYQRNAEAHIAAGRSVGQICQEIHASEQTYYHRKRLVADLSMDNAMLNSLPSG